MHINPLSWFSTSETSAQAPTQAYARPALVNRVKLAAVGAFAIYAATCVPAQAEAGFAAIAICSGWCSSITLGAFMPACIAACIAGGAFVPTP